jgi:hypothetical protein
MWCLSTLADLPWPVEVVDALVLLEKERHDKEKETEKRLQAERERWKFSKRQPLAKLTMWIDDGADV